MINFKVDNCINQSSSLKNKLWKFWILSFLSEIEVVLDIIMKIKAVKSIEYELKIKVNF